MSAHINKTPAAQQDLRELACHIATDNLEAALRFLDAAEAALQQLAQMPLLGEACHFQTPEAAGIRLWMIPRFPNYLLFYRPTKQGIDIIRVLHAARDITSLFKEETEH